MDRSEAGYTLGERLAVVLVLSIAASDAIANICASDPEKVELAAQEFAQAIRFARSEARRTGEPYGFELPAVGKRIRVFKADVGTSPWTLTFDVLHPIGKNPYHIDLETHRFARAENLIHDRAYRGTCNAEDSIYFDGQGVTRS